jgi:predicted  nucleic acid-binding Zn-ribbon protein
MSKAESLYRLQLLDSQLDAAVRRIREIDIAIANNGAVAHAKEELARAEKQRLTSSVALKALEMDVQTLDERIQTDEQRLYAGLIKATKEMLDTQKEVDSLKKRRTGMDDAVLAAMEQAEDAKTAEANCRKALNDATQKWEEDGAALKREREELMAKALGFREQRQSAVAAIPRPDLDAYVNLRTKKPNGVAVSLIKNGSCGQCGETPSSQQLQQARVGTALTMCSTCGRILYGV